MFEYSVCVYVAEDTQQGQSGLQRTHSKVRVGCRGHTVRSEWVVEDRGHTVRSEWVVEDR